MGLTVIQIILVLFVAFLAGVEGILDEFHFHQPVVACTLIGLVSGDLVPFIIFVGTLQFSPLASANMGAAVAQDAAVASTASAVILVHRGQGVDDVNSYSVMDSTLAIVGLIQNSFIRKLGTGIVHFMDAATKKGNI